jgi:hypothetical protein
MCDAKAVLVFLASTLELVALEEQEEGELRDC